MIPIAAKRCRRAEKGQIFSADLIAAVSVFLIVLSFVWYTWDDLQYGIDYKLEKSEMEHLALLASDALVMTSGYPHNWSASPESASAIGIANMPRVISPERLSAFSSLAYSQQRGQLGMGGRDFWLGIKNESGDVLASAGLFPAGDFQIGISRPVIYNGRISTLNLVVWEDYASGFAAYEAYSGIGR